MNVCLKEFLLSIGAEGLQVIQGILKGIEAQLELWIERKTVEQDIANAVGSKSLEEVAYQKGMTQVLGALEKIKGIMPIGQFRNCVDVNEVLGIATQAVSVTSGGLALFQSLSDRAEICQYIAATEQQTVQDIMDYIDQVNGYIDEVLNELVGV